MPDMENYMFIEKACMKHSAKTMQHVDYFINKIITCFFLCQLTKKNMLLFIGMPDMENHVFYEV